MSAPTPIDISPEQREIVLGILRKHIPDREVWAFGSRVWGGTKRFSDLDLVVAGDEPLPLAVWGNLKEDFSESDLPIILCCQVLTLGDKCKLISEQGLIYQSSQEDPASAVDIPVKHDTA